MGSKTQTISAAEYQALLKTKHPTTAPKPQQDSRLVQRFNALLLSYGWHCGECRRPCNDPRSLDNTGSTVARANTLVMWREDTVFCAQRVRVIGWIWDVAGWSDAQIRQLCTRRTEAFGCREIPE